MTRPKGIFSAPAQLFGEMGGCEGGVPDDETNRWMYCSTILQLTQRSVVGGIRQPYIPKG